MSDAGLIGQFLNSGSFDTETLLNSMRCKGCHVPFLSTERPDRASCVRSFRDPAITLSVSFEVLHVALVFFGLLKGGKCSQIAALAGLNAFLSRIQTKLSGLEFANHTREDALPRRLVARTSVNRLFGSRRAAARNLLGAPRVRTPSIASKSQRSSESGRGLRSGTVPNCGCRAMLELLRLTEEPG